MEFKTSEGSLTAKLALRQSDKKLSATLWIDNHVLKGEGETDGRRFEVLVVHADGSSPGHSERIQLTGRLDGDKLEGSFDNGDVFEIDGLVHLNRGEMTVETKKGKVKAEEERTGEEV